MFSFFTINFIVCAYQFLGYEKAKFLCAWRPAEIRGIRQEA